MASSRTVRRAAVFNMSSLSNECSPLWAAAMLLDG
jgi:hypothetical protein